MPKTKRNKLPNNNPYGSPERRVLNNISNTPTKGKGKEKQLNSRPKREARRQSKKLDFRGENEFFDEPSAIELQNFNSSSAVHFSAPVSPEIVSSPLEFQTLNSHSPVYFDQESDDEEKGPINDDDVHKHSKPNGTSDFDLNSKNIPSASMDIDDVESNYSESCYLSDTESETSSNGSNLEESDVNVSDVILEHTYAQVQQPNDLINLSAPFFHTNIQTAKMLGSAAAASVSAVDEKLNVFQETLDSVQKFDPAASSSDVPPPLKKAKLDSIHVREHKGKTYNLSDYGFKNFEKLLKNKQLERGVKSKKCLECDEVMDWKVDGPLQKKKLERWFNYKGRHNGICVKKGQNDKNHSKEKKAANEARAVGNCPGYPLAIHKTHVPKVPGKSFCIDCQAKVNANINSSEQHARVVRSEEKRVAKETNVEVLIPVVTSLQSVDIRTILPLDTVEKLWNLSQFVGVDSENRERGGMTAIKTYEWVFRDFASGSTLHLKRYHKNWNMTCDSTPKNFIGQKTLMYFAASEGCDKKRLMDWMGYKDLNSNYNDRALSFKWFNLDWQVCRKIFGPAGAIVTPTCKLLTLFNHLYQVPGTNVSVPTPPGYIDYGSAGKCETDVIQMFNLAQALSLSILTRTAS